MATTIDITPLALQVILASCGLISSIFSGWITFLIAKMSHETKLRDAQAARHVESVRNDLAEDQKAKMVKLDALASVAKATHTLVNSNMGVQLLLNRNVTKRLADMTGDPVDLHAAAIAAEIYANHISRQAEVDAQISNDLARVGYFVEEHDSREIAAEARDAIHKAVMAKAANEMGHQVDHKIAKDEAEQRAVHTALLADAAQKASAQAQNAADHAQKDTTTSPIPDGSTPQAIQQTRRE